MCSAGGNTPWIRIICKFYRNTSQTRNRLCLQIIEIRMHMRSQQRCIWDAINTQKIPSMCIKHINTRQHILSALFRVSLGVNNFNFLNLIFFNSSDFVFLTYCGGVCGLLRLVGACPAYMSDFRPVNSTRAGLPVCLVWIDLFQSFCGYFANYCVCQIVFGMNLTLPKNLFMGRIALGVEVFWHLKLESRVWFWFWDERRISRFWVSIAHH